MHDLGAVASNNDSLHRAAADAAIEADATGRLAEFRTQAAASEWCSNVWSEKLTVFARCSEVLDARRFCLETTALPPQEALSQWEEREWSARRQAFEDLWDDGRSAVYGAVVWLGGLGVEAFGPFSLVTDDPEAGSRGVGVFPGDTAQRYTDTAAAVDEQRATQEVAGWGSRADLVTKEAAVRAASGTPSDWPSLVCGPDHYFEAMRLGALPIKRIKEIRVPQTIEERLTELTDRLRRGEALTTEERHLLAAGEAAQQLRRRLGIIYRVID